MNKTQRLRNTAEGFMAGLVANGYTEPFSDRGDWEFAFRKAWDAWPAKDRNPKDFPKFGISAYCGVSEPRNMIWQLMQTSPFVDYENGLNQEPRGFTPEDYLETFVEGATADEWIGLAAAFLREMDKDS